MTASLNIGDGLSRMVIDNVAGMMKRVLDIYCFVCYIIIMPQRTYSRYAVEKATAYLSTGLRARKWNAGDRLPAIELLAREAGVSLVTMWRAARSVAEQGLIDIRPRKGIYAGPAGLGNRTTSRPNVDAVHRLLLADCFEGRFHNEPALPSVKELMSIYGAGYRTMTAALGRLIANGTIERRKRRYLPRRRIAGKTGGATVLLITGPDLVVLYEQSYYRSTAELFAQYLEQQCAMRNIRILRAAVQSDSTTIDLGAAGDALGCVIWTSEIVRRLLPSIIEQLDRLHKRVAVFFHTDQGENERTIAMHRGKACFMGIGSELSGYAVGNELLRLGHRRACFIAYKSRPWAQERYRGLVRAFSNAGLTDAVSWVCAEETAAAGPGVLSADARQALADDRRFNELRSEVLGSGIAVPFSNRLVARIEELAFCRWLQHALEPLLAQCLKDRKVTAWIAADDFVGLFAAMPFLQSRRVRIPRDISLIGFNDQIESSYYGLSSYHFDMTGMAMRMLTFLLHPLQDQRLRPRTEAGAVEGIGGFIVDRGSMGKARS
jgi:DNA-binding LacI/PurR family transcriptional regulator/DNA-binding transcriptional regulator YhcF (GntR family)